MIPERLENVEWLERAEVQAIFAALGGGEGRTRAVGGVVRDTLLGRLRPDADIDMATELTPHEVMRRAKASAITAYPTGIDHGTVTLRLNQTLVEVTTLREDVETDGRHAQVRFGTDWGGDAARRDFTINALYCCADGTLFDPLGGAGDAINGRVRFIGDAEKRIAEDGLRVYRFFRFSASHAGETLDADGLAACRRAVGHLDHISAERIGSEMLRMLALPRIARTLGVMREIGLLPMPAQSIAAALRYEALGGQSAAARLALLGQSDMAGLQRNWRLSNAIADTARRIHSAAALFAEGKPGWAAYRFGEDAVEGLAIAAATNAWPRDQLAEVARELARLQVRPMPVSGQDLLERGIPAGPGLGASLARLEALWVESEFSLDPEQLLAHLGD